MNFYTQSCKCYDQKVLKYVHTYIHYRPKFVSKNRGFLQSQSNAYERTICTIILPYSGKFSEGIIFGN